MAVIGTEAWNFSDIFKLNKIEIEATKMEVAQYLDIPWKTHLPSEKCFALPVAGVEPISDQKIEKNHIRIHGCEEQESAGVNGSAAKPVAGEYWPRVLRLNRHQRLDGGLVERRHAFQQRLSPLTLPC